MSEEQKQIKAVVDDARACSSQKEQDEYLTRSCPDAKVRRKVEALLANQEKDNGDLRAKRIRVQPIDMAESLPGFEKYLGQILDQKYRLEALVGKGGMGGVFLSIHLGTGRQVAVKLIMPEFMRTPALVDRFKREARAAGRLRHPNIVDVTDFGIAWVGGEQIAYLVMEYLDGCTLSDILAKEPRLPLRWVIEVLEQVCSAVQAAHQRGIVHRDLKPANIWLEPNTLGGYRVRVLDFGIAKLNEEAEPQVEATPLAFETASSATKGQDVMDQALTQAGAILGTPAYMSPEQCRGGNAGVRSDIYSLGVIAYQMLSGRLPFTGTAGAIIRAHQETEPIPLRELGMKVPKALSHLLTRALSKDPQKRPENARTFAHLLRAYTESFGGHYRRAFSLYSEYFPQIIKLSFVAHLPTILVTGLTVALVALGPQAKTLAGIPVKLPLGFLKAIATFVTGSMIAGMVAIMVVGLTASPLSEVTLRVPFHILRRHWWPFLSTGLLATFRVVLGFIFLIVPGLILMVRYSLWASVVLMEEKVSRTALRRSGELVSRSWPTCILTVLFQMTVPGFVEAVVRRLIISEATPNSPAILKIVSELTALSSIFVLPLVSIVVALVFLKMRRLGGEDFPALVWGTDKRGGARP